MPGATRHHPNRVSRDASSRRRRSAGRALGGAEDQAHDHGDHDQVGHHLDGDDDPRRVGGRCDVAEADGREDRHREVQRRDPIEGLGERVGRGPGHRQVGPREHHDEYRDHERHCVGRTQHGTRRAEDRAHLVDEDHDEQCEADREAEEHRRVRFVADRHREVHNEHQESGRGRTQPGQEEMPALEILQAGHHHRENASCDHRTN